jgi:hypothetical protein
MQFIAQQREIKVKITVQKFTWRALISTNLKGLHLFLIFGKFEKDIEWLRKEKILIHQHGNAITIFSTCFPMHIQIRKNENKVVTCYNEVKYYHYRSLKPGAGKLSNLPI